MKTKTNRTLRKILSIALCIALVMSYVPMVSIGAFAATSPTPYDGIVVTPLRITSSNYLRFGLTSDNWSSYNGYYGIRTASELYGFAALVNSSGGATVNAILLNDIVINQTVSENGATYDWTPIGVRDNPFIGTIDGNGHSISGVYCVKDSDLVGLFGLVGTTSSYPSEATANIKNIVLKNSYISGEAYIGGIAGAVWGNHVTISLCKVEETVTVCTTSTKSNVCLGGIVGGYIESSKFMTRVNQVTACVCFGTVKTDYGEYRIGAITGNYREPENAMELIEVSGCYYLQGCATDCNGNAMLGRGCMVNQTNAGCSVLSGTSASHDCNSVSVTHKEKKATCEYIGWSEYSYCLICGELTSGTKTSYAIIDHNYSDATCVTPATCSICKKTTGSVLSSNHEGEVTTYERYDAECHYGVYNCCGAHTENMEHDYSIATCLDVATCSLCEGTNGNNPENHKTDTKIYGLDDTDVSKHNYKWECCGVVISTESHDFNDDYSCTKCFYVCDHAQTVNGICAVCSKHAVAYVNRYWDSITNKVVSENSFVNNAQVITSDTTSLSNGWYIVESEVQISSRISVSGTVNIILCDSGVLTASSGIAVNSGATLNIYAQAKGTGILNAVSQDNNAAIGGEGNQSGGSISINGGYINATSNSNGAGIGGGYYGNGGTITITGGVVTVTCEYYGAGIGGGYHGNGEYVNIHGGTISTNTKSGAGIGGGEYGNGAVVLITGGNVKTKTTYNVFIGKGWRGESVGTLKNANGDDVSLVTFTVNGTNDMDDVTAVGGLENYGLTDVKILDGNKLYFYLPAEYDAKYIFADGVEYGCKSENTFSTHTIDEGICTICGGYDGATLNSDGYYELYNAGQLMWFAQRINGGAIANSSNAILMADIDMTDIAWTPIGSTELYYSSTYSNNDYSSVNTGYKGIFDGNGHSIKNLSITGSETETLSFGLFGTLSGTVKNLGIENLIYTGAGMDSRVGAIAGQVLYGGEISNCYVKNASINTKVNTENGVAGGIAGCNYAGTIENSFVYDITITAGRIGGIVGDNRADTEGDRLGTVYNCYTNFESVCGGNKGIETNSKHSLSEASFTKGTVTWYLNEQSANGTWKQNGKLPGFTGTAVEQSVLSTYEQPEIKDGVYQIANKSQFFWFAEYVNFTDTGVDAVLVNDIDLANEEWVPIGYFGNSYSGTFDGQGYSITNFKMTITGTRGVGLFGDITNATVRNFNVYGEASMNYSFRQPSFYGVVGASNASNVTGIKSYVNLTVNDSYMKNSIAGIVGYIVTSTIEECAFYGTIDLGNAPIDCGGGIVAYGNYNNSHVINNCAFYGTIHSDNENSGQLGGIIGYYRGSNIVLRNCLSVGTMDIENTTFTGMLGGRVLGLGSSNLGNIANNYFYKTEDIPDFSATTDYTYSDIEPSDYSGYGVANAKNVTAIQLASGEVAYLLQQGNTEQVWGQDSNQAGATPILDSTGFYKVVTVAQTGNYSVANVGDINGDDTVDVIDYQVLVNAIIADDHEQSETASYDDIVKYDLDGDGYLDVIDAYLLHLFINGFTTVDVYAVGDYDLNGVAFEEADIKAIKHAIENPEKLATYKKYASDINGDGKLDENDLTVLTAKYGEVTGTECADNVKVYYRWGNKYSTCTATAMCTLCGEKVATETVNTTSETLAELTCTQDGKVKYTATFQNELLGTKTIEIVSKAEGHKYNDGECSCGMIQLNIADISKTVYFNDNDNKLDLSTLFTLPDGAGNVTYELLSGEGTLDGSILNIVLQGTEKIKVTVAETETCSADEFEITVTVEAPKGSGSFDGEWVPIG